MRKFIQTALITMLLSVCISFGAEKVIKVKTNLHCGSCKNKIEKALNKTDGILSTSADLDSKIVTINFDDAKTDDSKVTNVITELGYKAELIQDKPKESPKTKAKVKKK